MFSMRSESRSRSSSMRRGCDLAQASHATLVSMGRLKTIVAGKQPPLGSQEDLSTILKKEPSDPDVFR